MRQIKFRAWNTDTKSMHWVTKLFMDGLGINPSHSMELDGEGCYGDLFPLMQFTGLKDKNRKEIYEGDVVEWESDRVSIEFRDGTFGYVKFDHQEKTEEFWCMMEAKAKRTEVIGNIYENTGLLPKTDF